MNYLGKPFALEELVARIEALLRRPGTLLGGALRLGMVTFDTKARELAVNDKIQPMPPRETAVLETLLRRNGHVVPKKIIEDQLYGLSEDGSPNAIEVYVHRLRKLLSDCKRRVEIHTNPWSGISDQRKACMRLRFKSSCPASYGCICSHWPECSERSPLPPIICSALRRETLKNACCTIMHLPSRSISL